MSLAKAAKDYYLRKLGEISPREDYYLRGGTAAGRWCGSGAEDLGLAGTVSVEGLVRLFDGQHPGTGEQLGRSLRRAGLSVRYNQPYSGMAGMMYAVDRHGSHHRLPCLELEIRQDLLLERSNIARIGAATTTIGFVAANRILQL